MVRASAVMDTLLRYCLLLLIFPWLVQGQRLADEKCLHYRENIAQTASIIELTVNPKPYTIQRLNCSQNVDLIVGGRAAEPGEFPHQALLGWPLTNSTEGYDFRCGGTLISEWYVLTAAHCFSKGDPKIVRLGENDLREDYDDAIDIGAESVIKHPKYKSKRSYHDIALVKLEDEVTLSDLIRPACLWSSQQINVTSAITTGFGHTVYGGTYSDTLQKVKLDILPKRKCERQFRGQRRFPDGVTDQQLCIGSKVGGKDSCSGDSGGPVQVVHDPLGCIYHVLAITGTGSGCGFGTSPSVYTRVTPYLDWIERIVWT